jgi:hypothetical protein
VKKKNNKKELPTIRLFFCPECMEISNTCKRAYRTITTDSVTRCLTKNDLLIEDSETISSEKEFDATLLCDFCSCELTEVDVTIEAFKYMNQYTDGELSIYIADELLQIINSQEVITLSMIKKVLVKQMLIK